MPDDLKVTVKRGDEYVVVYTDGYINNIGGGRIAKECYRLIDEGFRHFILNLKKSRDINSVGASILMEVIERVQGIQGSLSFCNLTPTITKTFQITRLSDAVHIYEDEAEAIETVAPLWAAKSPGAGPFKPIPQNPYIVGIPIRTRKMFYGMEDTFNDARQMLEREHGGIIIVLVGEKRSGKSSILYQILDGRLGESFIPIFIDMQIMMAIARSDKEFYEKVAVEICNTLDHPKIKINHYDFDSGNPPEVFEDLVDDTLDEYEGKRILFLFDEYELLEEKIGDGDLSRDVILFLSGLLESKGRVCFIFTGSRKLEERKIAYWRLMVGKALYKKISFLSERDTIRLITEPVKDSVVYDRKIPESIYRLTAGQPYYTQVICQKMFEHLNEVEKNHVQSEDLESVVEDAVEDPTPHMIFTWDSFSRGEKVVLSLLGELIGDEKDHVSAAKILRAIRKNGYQIELPAENINVILEDLSQRDVLYKRRRGSYCFKVDLFRLWIRRAHSIWQVMDEVKLVSREPIEVTAPARVRRRGALLIPTIAALVVIAVVSAIYLFQRPDVERTVVPRIEGMMWVKSDPDSAEIYLDEETLSRGITPDIIPGLSPEMHRVELRKEGYVSAVDSAEVFPDSTVVIRLALVQKTGIVFIRSNPPDAEVYVDRDVQSSGPTPKEIKLTVGSHSLRLEKTGYAEAVRKVEVIADSTVEVPVVVLQREFGGVVIRSIPPGVEVYVDEKKQEGKTPLTLEKLTTGPHTLRLRKEGYEGASRGFVVIPDSTVTLEVIKLARVLGRLVILSTPLGAQVYVNDGKKERVGETPWTISDLSPGKYQVRVEHEGYDPVEQSIEVQAGENDPLTVPLERQYGSLKISVDPWAEVYIDGKEYGDTPIAEPIKLPVGTHILTLTNPGYNDSTITNVRINKDEKRELKVKLRKK